MRLFSLGVGLSLLNATLFAYPQSIDALCGGAALPNCKDCVEDSFSWSECHHWNPNVPDPNNPGQNLPTACKANACIENIDYWASCSPAASTEANCNQETQAALFYTQQVRTGGGPFACGVDPGGNTANWPKPSEGVTGFPVDGACQTPGRDNIKGKCFIAGCGGTDVDEIDGEDLEKSYTESRSVCVW